MQEIESDLTLDAVFGIKDPLRPDVKDAVRAVRYAPLPPFILFFLSFIASSASAVAIFSTQPPFLFSSLLLSICPPPLSLIFLCTSFLPRLPHTLTPPLSLLPLPLSLSSSLSPPPTLISFLIILYLLLSLHYLFLPLLYLLLPLLLMP
jgi:hypothetical protein